MPYDITRQFPRTIINLFEHTYAKQAALVKINLGGTSGSGGGSGTPPGGYAGQLSQRYVAYDTDEAISSGSTNSPGGVSSLVDNLNRIRYWIQPARWFEPSIAGGNLNIGAGIWWTSGSTYLDYAGGSIATPASGKIYLDSSGSICNDADWPQSGTFNPICIVTGSVISDDVRKFFNEGGAAATSGSGTPGGSNTYVQFNDNGAFGGAAGLTWDGTKLASGEGLFGGTLAVSSGSITDTSGSISFGNEHLKTLGDITCNTLHYTALDPAIVSGAHDLLSATHADTTPASPPQLGSLIYANGTPTVTWQELTLASSGAAGSVLTRDANAPLWSGFLLAGIEGGLTTFDVANGENLTLSAAGSYTITFPNDMAFPADAAGVLTSDGAFGLSWGPGGGGVPGGNNTDLQFNNAGAFDGSDNATWDGTRALFQISDAATNTVVYPLRMSHTTSGSSAASFGVGLEFQIENASGNNKIAVSLDGLWKDATNAAEYGAFRVNLIGDGTLREAIVITSAPSSIAGNARGISSVDLQVVRSNATYVASGEGAGLFAGQNNTASATLSTVIGGVGNVASQAVSAIVGGTTNVISGGGDGNSAIIAGSACDISSDWSLAGGTRAHITHNGVFAWGDAIAEDFHSIIAGEAIFRARGGFRILYDDTYYLKVIVGSSGAVELSTTGTTFMFSDYVGVGITPRYLLDVAGTGTESKISVQRSSGSAAAAASAAGTRVIRSRGETVGSEVAINSGDYLGFHELAGYYNASTVWVGAYASAIATENWSVEHRGAKLVWGVTANGWTSGSLGAIPMELDATTGLLLTLPITISNAAPSLVFTDTNNNAKGLTIAVDANAANFRESAGAASSLLVLDLENNRVGVGTAPSYDLHIAKTITGVGTYASFASLPTFTPGADGAAAITYAGFIRVNATGTDNTGTVYGVTCIVNNNTTAGTMTSQYGLIGQVASQATSGTSTTTTVYALRGVISKSGANAEWIIGTAYGVQIPTVAVSSGSLTGTTLYGLYVGDFASPGGTWATKWAVYSTAGNNYFGGPIFVNDTADGDITTGICVNQGSADNAILSFKSSDIAHGMTSVWETDSYGVFCKSSGASGGMDIWGMTEVSGGINIYGLEVTNRTAHTTSGLGAVNVIAGKKSGTSYGANDANANLFSISDYTAVRFIFDKEGDSFEDGTGWTAYDDRDDAGLLDLVNTAMTFDPIKGEFWSWVNENAKELERLKLVYFNPDGHHFINRSKMQELLVGAVRQMSRRLGTYERAFASLGVDTKQLA